MTRGLTDRPVTAHPWPALRPQLAAQRLGVDGPLVIRIATEHTNLREAAREQIRHALREVLGELFDVPVSAVELAAVPGEPMQARVRERTVCLSVSHDAGMSVAAVNLRGPVGVDIMRLPEDFAWEDVARDYLDPDTARRIGQLAPANRLTAFAKEWTRLEACLKCTGIGLSEWSAAREECLHGCRVRTLTLPAGWTGSIATRESDQAS